MLVVGIDAGGTKTVCQLGDETGRLLREARGPGANLQSAGELEVEKVLHDVLDEALGGESAPAALCLGMAGVDRPRDSAIVRGIVRRLCRFTRTLVVNDALIALEAGAPDAPGVVLIAGTGSIAYGRNAQGQAARAGGWGHILGDEGSGFWLGRQAVSAILRAADHRGPSTSLTAPVMAHFDVTRPQDLVHPIYDGGIRPRALAALAPLVAAAATEGDAVAQQLIETGASELAGAALSVAGRLDLMGAPFPLPLAGGIFRSVPIVRERVCGWLAARAPMASAFVLEAEPAAGARQLARHLLRGESRVPIYLDS